MIQENHSSFIKWTRIDKIKTIIEEFSLPQ